MHEGVESAYRMLRPRIRSTHVHDNNGKEDQHLCPLLSEGGTIDWRRAMYTLRANPEQYPLLLELKEMPELGNPVDAARRVFDQLEELKGTDES